MPCCCACTLKPRAGAGARSELRLGDLDMDLCLVLLREKGGTHRRQPVSPTLATALSHHARARGASAPEDALLRTRRHRPVSRSHYDMLWGRIRAVPPWAGSQQISTHWLRDTTLTWGERHFGYGAARATSPATPTATAPPPRPTSARLSRNAPPRSRL